MKKLGLFGLLLIINVIVYINHNACNKKGTLAHDINWAGHNCEELEREEVNPIEKKKVKKKKKTVEDKAVKKAGKLIKKWLEDGAAENEKKEEKKKEEKKVEEKDEYSIQVEIDKCYADFDNTKHNIWSYVSAFFECKKKELLYQNCYYIEDAIEKATCTEEAKEEAATLAGESRSEYFQDTPEEIARKEQKKTDEKEELKNTMKEAFKEMEE